MVTHGYSRNGIGELGPVCSLQMFIEQLVCRRLKVQVAVSITASLWCAATHPVCLSRT